MNPTAFFSLQAFSIYSTYDGICGDISGCGDSMSLRITTNECNMSRKWLNREIKFDSLLSTILIHLIKKCGAFDSCEDKVVAVS